MASSSKNLESKSSIRKRKLPTSNPFLPSEACPASTCRKKTKLKTSTVSVVKPAPETQGKSPHESNSDKGSDQQFLSNATAYILQAGLGKARTDIFKKQMSKFGADVLDEWDDTECTHLIVDEGMDIQRLQRILQLDKPPLKAEILKASWLSLCLSEEKLMPTDDHVLKFPVKRKEFVPKINPASITISARDKSTKDETGGDYGAPIKNETSKQTSEDARDLSDIASSSGTSNAQPAQGSKWTSPSKAVVSDRGYDSDDSNHVPSEDEEYQDALRMTTESDEASSSSNMSTPATSPQKLPKGNWVCSKPSTAQQTNFNHHITEKLELLMKTYTNTKDHWRSLGYRKAITALKQHPKEVTSWEEANKIPGIGTRLADKIWEIIESGHLRKIDHVCGGEDMKALDLFNNIWGVGPTVAQEWVQLGFRTLDDVREKAKLNRQQKIGLQHYHDFLERMPRQEAGEIERMVREMAVSIDPGMLAVVCGSYRRGKATCGDVDVLITHPDGKSHRGALGKILDGLRAKG